jgi:hypothetical protein
MSSYTLNFQNESSDSLNFTIFQKPPKAPDLHKLAWHTVPVHPGAPVYQLPVPVEFEGYEFYVAVSEYPDEQVKSSQIRVHPGQTCKASGDKGNGYVLAVE